MKVILGLIALLTFSNLNAQDSIDTSRHELSLLFIGDIMGHGPQITSAYNKATKKYNYNSVFRYLTP